MRTIIRTALVILAIVLARVPALATDSVLSRDNGVADTFEKLATDGHYIALNSPAWPHTFASELELYGYRFGKVGDTLGTVVLWDVQPVKDPKPGDPTRQAHIISSKQFRLDLAPEKAGWFSVPLDASELPRSFGVSVFTHSTDSAGLWLGLTAKAGTGSFSSAGVLKELGAATHIKLRHDGRNWLIRLKVRDSIKSQTAFSTEQVTGAKFVGNDDGSAEGFATTQKDGPIVKFTTDGTHRLKHAYVYAKLDGTNWFHADRMAGVWVLNQDYGIMCHANLQYSQFTNDPGWGSIDLPDIALPQTFYVLIEPVSRPESELMIGYDSSSANHGSYFGSAGALHKWAIEAPEDKVNWMVRVEYK